MAGPLDDKDELIAAADLAFADGLKGVDEQLAKEIIKIYASFVIGGELVLDAQALAQLEDALIAAIAKTDYKLVIDAYIPNYDAVNDLNKLLHKQVNGIDINKIINENTRIANHLSIVESRLKGTPSTVIKVVDMVGTQEVIKSVPIRNSSLDELIQPIANVIRRDVIMGTSFESATESILEAISKKELGLEQWAGQIAQDGLKQADGIVNQQVKEEFKMKYSRYVGTIKQTTRPICYHLLTKKEDPVYTDAEITSVLAEYIPGGIPSDSVTSKTANRKPQKKGSGMIPGTDTQNFSVRRGGYRCRHDFIPLVKKSNSNKL